MARYPAIIDGEAGAYGVSFPDLPGCVAMGETLEEAMLNAEEALHDFANVLAKEGKGLPAPSAPEAVQVGAGETLTSIPLILQSGKSVRANVTVDEATMMFFDTEADRRGMTRSAYLNWAARRLAAMGG